MGALLPLSVVLATLFVGLMLIAVIATRLYQALGDRLNQPLKD